MVNLKEIISLTVFFINLVNILANPLTATNETFKAQFTRNDYLNDNLIHLKLSQASTQAGSVQETVFQIADYTLQPFYSSGTIEDIFNQHHNAMAYQRTMSVVTSPGTIIS